MTQQCYSKCLNGSGENNSKSNAHANAKNTVIDSVYTVVAASKTADVRSVLLREYGFQIDFELVIVKRKKFRKSRRAILTFIRREMNAYGNGRVRSFTEMTGCDKVNARIGFTRRTRVYL